MDSVTPKVSVLMPVYNAERHLNESIDSILNQTFTDFELVIVNDGSTDGSVDIIQSYKDPRICLFHMPENSGVASALNEGLNHCRGKYIARMDADDWSHPDRLQKQYEFLKKGPEYGMVRSFVQYIPENEVVEQNQRFLTMKQINERYRNAGKTDEELHRLLYMYLCICHAVIMVKSDIIKQFGYTYLKTGEDYKLFYDMNKAGVKIGTLRDIHLKIKVRLDSSSGIHMNYYPDIVFEIKKHEIKKIVDQSKNTYIWGTGSQARFLYNAMKSRDLKVTGFVDYHIEKEQKVNSLPVFKPDQIVPFDSQNGILVAAQPVREQVCSFLEQTGYVHLEQYLVFM